MKETGKNRIFIYGAIALLIIIVLTQALGNIKLTTPAPKQQQTRELKMPSQAPVTNIPDMGGSFFLALLPVFFIVAAVALVIGIFIPKARKIIITGIIMVLMGLLGLVIFDFFHEDQEFVPPEKEEEEKIPEEPLPTESTREDDRKDEEEFSAKPSEILVTVVTIVLILAIAYAIFRTLLHLARTKSKTPPIEELAKQAQEALGKIQSGLDLKHIIIRCYFEMNRILSKQKGLKRDDGMTPREFENSLIEAGLPMQDVVRITRFFERVRYGAKSLSEQEEGEAIDCLSAIVRHCEEPDEEI